MLRTFLESDLAKRKVGSSESKKRYEEYSATVFDLLGRIDLLIETDDSVVIQDFKTARSVWDQDQADQSSEQLILYGELVRRFLPRKKLKLRFAILTKTQTPKVQQLESSFDESRLEHTKHAFENVWSAIQAGHFYPNPSPMNCSGCGFRSACSHGEANQCTNSYKQRKTCDRTPQTQRRLFRWSDDRRSDSRHLDGSFVIFLAATGIIIALAAYEGSIRLT